MITNGSIAGKVGAYFRLSREDGDKLESDSIRNQRKLITEFLEKNPRMRLIREYVDDGYSGTNFDRPDFIRMVNDAQAGRINCIIVKDLSRLGRNYIETGRYIEKILPAMGIRLIAVNDNYDSADKSSDESQIIIPFKNLINDAYCRDISLKIRSHLDVKRKSGQYIGSFALYGYKKDPDNKSHLIIDEYAAGIVERIFNMKLNGYGAAKIAEKLNEEGVQPPFEYKRKCGFKFDSGFKSCDGAGWCEESVDRILKNEMYTGKMIQGKIKKINYKVKKSLPTEKNEWFCVEGTHEPIISKERFELVQSIMEKDTRTPPDAEHVFPMSGYVKCGSCQQNMVRRVVTSGKRYVYYHCSTYKAGGNCTSHIVRYDTVENAVLSAIQQQLTLLDKIESVLKLIDERPSEQIAVLTIDRQLEKLKENIEYYGNLMAKLYKDMVDGVVSRVEYNDLHNRFDRSRKAVEETYNKLLEKKNLILSGQVHLQPWVESLKKYRNLTELSRSAVVALIDKVIVNDSKDIRVVFSFEDELQSMMKYIGNYPQDEEAE